MNGFSRNARFLRWGGLLVALLCLGSGCGTTRDRDGSPIRYVIQAGMEREVEELFAPQAIPSDLAGGRLERVQIEGERIRALVVEPDGAQAWVEIGHPEQVPAGYERAGNIAFGWSWRSGAQEPGPVALALMATLRGHGKISFPWHQTGYRVREWTTADYYVLILLPVMWLLLMGLLAVDLGGCSRQRIKDVWGEHRWNFGVVALALVLRLWLPPFGPGDLFNSLEDAYGPWTSVQGFGYYGRAPEALLFWLFQIFPTQDATVVYLNLVLGAASVWLLIRVMVGLGFPSWVARFAGLFLAVYPLHVRLSLSYNRYILLVFLVLLGTRLLLRYLEERKLRLLVASMLVWTLAPQCRPESMFLPGILLGLVCALAVSKRASLSGLRSIPRIFWLAFLVHLLALVLPLNAVLNIIGEGASQGHQALLGVPVFSPDNNALLCGRYTPLVWPMLCLLGLLRIRSSNRVLILGIGATALMATASICSAPLIRHSIDFPNDNICSGRYHLLAMTFYMMLMAIGLLHLGRRWGTVLGLVVAAWAFVPMGHVVRSTTVNQEYDFLVENLSKVPDGCVIQSFAPRLDRGLRPHGTLSRSAGREHEWRMIGFDPPVNPSEVSCLVYYHNASCSSVQSEGEDPHFKEACLELRGQMVEVLSATTLVNDPLTFVRYKTDPIHVGLFWIQKP